MPAATARRTQPTPGYRLTEVADLTGGMDRRRALTQLRPQRSRRLLNWDLNNPGELTVYPGWETFSTTSLGAGRIQGGSRIYIKKTGGGTFTLAAHGGNIYQPTDGGVWGSAVSTALNNTNPVYFVHDRDLVAAFDGANIPIKSLDGLTWTQMGISPPTVAPTLGTAAGGSLLDGSTYEVSYAYMDVATYVFESNGSTNTSTQAVSGANLTITVSLTRSTDPQVDTITVYARNVTAGESVLRRVGTVANPVSGSASFNITSENWSSALEIPTDHDVWPDVSFGLVWKNRWWGVDADVPNRLHFSQVFLPQAKPALFYVDLPFEQGDDIQGIATLGDTMVAWGARNTFLVIGQTSLDFEVRPSLGSVAGIVGPAAWAQVESGVVHAASDGIYLFDGAQDRLLSQDIEEVWRTYVLTASSDVLRRTPMVYHQLRKEVRVGLSVLDPTSAAGELVLFLARSRDQTAEAWGTTDRNVGGYLPWDGPETVAGAYGRLFTWGQTTGRLKEEAVGTTADGSDITAIYEGPGLTTGIHQSRFIDTFGEYQPAAGLFSLEAWVDEYLITTITIDTGTAGSVFGTALFGTDVFARSARSMWSKMLPLDTDGRTIQIRLKYIGQESLTVFNYSLGVVPEPVPRGF